MLKKLIFIIILILSVQIVAAIYGGEKETIQHFDKCSGLNVNVAGALPINKTEYNLLNCSETNENEWECNCYDGFDLIMETKINTINNYSIEMVYSYGEEAIEETASSGHIPKLVCGNWSECIDNLQEQICKRGLIIKKNIRNCTIEEKHIEVNEPKKKEEIKQELNETKENEPKEEPKVEKFSYKWLIISIAIILVVCCLVIVYIKRR